MDEFEKCITIDNSYCENTERKWIEYRYEAMVAIATSLCTCTLGIQVGWISQAMRILTNNKDAPFQITPEQSSILAACGPTGSVAGAIIAFFLVNFWSRSRSLVVAAVPDILPFILYSFYPNFFAYCLGQFLTGVGGAIACSVAMMYAVEIASPELRGIIGVSMMIASNTGTFAVNCLIPLFDFRILTLCLVSVPICQFLICLFLPESPYLLLQKGREDEAKKVLQRLRNTKNVEREFKEMVSYTNAQFAQKITCHRFFADVTHRKVFLYIGILIFCQQLTGFASLNSYSQIIYSTGEAIISPEVCGVIYSLTGIIFPFMSGYFIHKYDRKFQFMISGFMVSGSLFALGLYLYFKHQNYQFIDNWAIIPLASMLTYQFGFGMGYGPLVLLYMNEILPTNIRAIGTTIGSIGFNSVAILVVWSFVGLQQKFGAYAPLWGYAICTVFSSFVIKFYLPETRGQTLTQINRRLSCT